MLIPYFYLEAGDIKIFQPQNVKKAFEHNFRIDGVAIRIVSMHRPESERVSLYLNGAYNEYDYAMIRLNTHSDRFITAIKLINKGSK